MTLIRTNNLARYFDRDGFSIFVPKEDVDTGSLEECGYMADFWQTTVESAEEYCYNLNTQWES